MEPGSHASFRVVLPWALDSCKSCHASCETCFSSKPHGCLTCPQGHFLHIDSCTDVCPKETYLDGVECKHCPHACNKCQSPVHCTACRQGYFLLHNKFNQSAECVESCGPGKYPDQGGVCRPCHSSCRQLMTHIDKFH